MDGAAPSHDGRKGAMVTPIRARMEEKRRPEKMPWRTMSRAPVRSSAPILWAICTEKPEAKAVHSPPKSQMVVDTSPTMADS
mgnify:CR=1 FL=1